MAFGGGQDTVEAAIDEQHGEAVDDRPSANGPAEDGEAASVRRMGICGVCAAHEEAGGFRSGLGESGAGEIQPFGAEHQEEHRGFCARKGDVRLSSGIRDGTGTGAFLNVAEGVVEYAVADGGKFAEQA